MNKQEGIKELEIHKMKSEDIRADCYNDGINAGIAVMKKLDEPQKPVVPKFVADWFEDNKDALDLAIFMAVRELDDEEWPHKTDFENWLDVAENKPIETLIRMKDGYEVKKEPPIEELELNDNQKIVLEWLKNELKTNNVLFTLWSFAEDVWIDVNKVDTKRADT